MGVCSSCGREDAEVHFCSACGRELLCGSISVSCPVAGCGERVIDPQYDRPERTEEEKRSIWGEDAFVEPRPKPHPVYGMEPHPVLHLEGEAARRAEEILSRRERERG